MDNLQDVVEKDYAPQVEIPDQIEQDQNDSLQTSSEIQEDNNQADQSDESNQESSNEEVEKELDKKWREQKKKLAKIQREKHRIAAEADQLRIENENLKKFNQTSNQVSQTHYENSLKLKLDQAKENKRKARELNDIDSELVADEELASVVADIRSMENWKAQQMIQQHEVEQQQKYQSQYQQQYQTNQHPEVVIDEKTERWLKQNPWFDKDSPHYDPDKAEDVMIYAQALDTNLANQGRDDEYLTKSYFDRINNYARLYDQQRNNSREERISNISNVAPVRRNGVTSRSEFSNMKLTDDEKFMARNAGISEDDWKKAKIEDMKRQKEKMRFQNPTY
jgi:hypothetical protein